MLLDHDYYTYHDETGLHHYVMWACYTDRYVESHGTGTTIHDALTDAQEKWHTRQQLLCV